MKRPLTRRQMQRCMAALYETMIAFDRQYGRKVFFFNDLCFYDHLRTYPVCGQSGTASPKTVDDLLDMMEPYIPLTLNEENFNLFIQAAQEAEMAADTADTLNPANPASASNASSASSTSSTSKAMNPLNPVADLPDYFKQKARIDFVTTLRKAEGPAPWDWMLTVCDTIREIKTELEALKI